MTDQEAALLAGLCYHEIDEARSLCEPQGWKCADIVVADTEAYVFTRGDVTVVGFRGTC